MTPLQIRTLWLTAPVVLGVVVYLLALDAWLVTVAPDDEATISATYGKLFRLWPVANTLVTAFLSLVAGHLVWGRDWSKVGRTPEPEPAPGDLACDGEGPRDAAS